VLQYYYIATAFAGFDSAEEARRSAADYDDVFLDRRRRDFPFVI
jgi:hypothetical protein